ncbi:MAG TPA: hypothetical protein ENI70_01160 [Candidatus Peregrinibacteria bacterium]|nr:hypothetical protein [Candidatus Peregrinibacteria bacterium]
MRRKGIKQKIRNIKRFNYIVIVLAKYGLGFVLEKLNLKVPFVRAKKGVKKLSLPKRIRLVFEELGPAFIKFGQILSTRPDVLPHSYIVELRKLQDAVPPFPGKEAKEQVIKQLRKPLKSLFGKFETNPIAAASIAQVHEAKLLTGEKVAVKVQRPDIRKTIDTDLDILYFLAELVAKEIPESRTYDPVGIIEEFDKSIHRELDFAAEGHSLEKFRINFKDDLYVNFPQVYWNFTTPKVLTMEYIEGIRVGDIAKLKRRKMNLKVIAERGASAFFKQVFLDGFFHADPHAGNIFVQKDENIVFLDCGMVGHIDDETMIHIANLLIAVISQDIEKMMNVFEDMEILNENVEIHKLRGDIKEFIDKYYNVSLKRIQIGQALNEIVEVIAHHHVRVPTDLVLLGKAMITIEGIGRQLDPDFDVVSQIKPFTKKILLNRFYPKKILGSVIDAAQEFQKFILTFPRELNFLTKKLHRGEVRIEFKHKGLEGLTSEMRRSSNILSFCILISSLIIGSSLIVQADIGGKIFGISLIGFVGYAIASLMALIWVIAIIKSGKK